MLEHLPPKRCLSPFSPCALLPVTRPLLEALKMLLKVAQNSMGDKIMDWTEFKVRTPFTILLLRGRSGSIYESSPVVAIYRRLGEKELRASHLSFHFSSAVGYGQSAKAYLSFQERAVLQHFKNSVKSCLILRIVDKRSHEFESTESIFSPILHLTSYRLICPSDDSRSRLGRV